MSAKARTSSAADTEGGLKPREGEGGGKRTKSLGLVPHILGICSHSGTPEAGGDAFVSLIKSDSPRRVKKPFAHSTFCTS